MFSHKKGPEAPKPARHPDDSPSPVLAALHLEQSFLFQRRVASGADDGAVPGVKNRPDKDLESEIDKVFNLEPVYEFLPDLRSSAELVSNRKSDSESNYEYLQEPLKGAAGLGPYRDPESSLHYEYLQWPKKSFDSGANYESMPAGMGGSSSYADPVDYQQSQIYDNLADYSDTDVSSRITMPLGNMFCSRCGEGFESQEKIVNSKGGLWHPHCFVCAQCFRPFPGGIFYEFEGRKYCEHDFHVLFAPCCGKCGEFVIGRVIKAMNANWHPKCFRCADCNKELADLGFIRNQGRALCHECHAQAKAVGQGKHVCHKCHGIIDDKPLRYRGEVYHPYHFNCTSCSTELDSNAREVKSRPGYTANDLNELYCLRCHDKMGVPICGACRRPIEERVVTALGKHWHVEHFVCARCEKPFLGHRHYEKKGLAYCETHYHQLFGNLCFVCNQVIGGDVFTALNKAWCVHHFACSVCDQKLNQKTKFYELDLKPTCKRCYDKFPAEMRHRLRKAFKNTPKKA